MDVSGHSYAWTRVLHPYQRRIGTKSTLYCYDEHSVLARRALPVIDKRGGGKTPHPLFFHDDLVFFEVYLVVFRIFQEIECIDLQVDQF